MEISSRFELRHNRTPIDRIPDEGRSGTYSWYRLINGTVYRFSISYSPFSPQVAMESEAINLRLSYCDRTHRVGLYG